jgi:hypothetical protein
VIDIRGWWQLWPLGFLIGMIGGCFGPNLHLTHSSQEDKTAEPAAYRMPAAKGMAELRMAMVHDVLVERYRRHGPAWDRAQRAAAEARVAADPADLDAYDDAAMAAERLADHAGAEALLRAKAQRQGLEIPQTPQPLACSTNHMDQDYDELKASAATLTPVDVQRYRTLANLGTVLVHAALPKVLQGDVAALPAAKEGLACLQASVRLNPAAHFGRERWQVVAIEHLLVAAQDPQWLQRFDFIGESLAGEPKAFPKQHAAWLYAEFAGKTSKLFDRRFTEAFTQKDADQLANDSTRMQIRRWIPAVGAEPAWIERVAGSRRCPAAFDQPVLGILGMWTLGGGANPHFALCLATIMERAGQGSIAWEAYEVAREMSAGFSPDQGTQHWLVERCRQRQDALASTRGGATWQTAMRVGMQHERAWALGLRQEYQSWEEQRLASGGPLVDITAEVAWWHAKPPLGSPTGSVDERHAEIRGDNFRALQALLLGVFGAGVGAFIASVLTFRPRSRQAPTTAKTPPAA